MLNRHRFVWLLLFIGLSTGIALAQDAACPDLVQTALDYIDAQCSGIERNQACYGNLQIEAVPQTGVTDFKFDTPGDIETIASIGSLNLSGMLTPDEWGVTLMSVQANLPDSTPGQNVTMLLFGDVTIENKGGAAKPVLLDVTANRNARVRSGPGTQNSQIASLPAGDAAQADGRNEAGDWLRVMLADGTAGWVSADLVDIAGDKTTLAVVEGVEIAGTIYGPMQAFYFTSGIGNPQCGEAPPDGILIQTPEGAGKIDLLINEVQIGVGSTVFFTAQPAGVMHVTVLDGLVSVTAAGTTLVVPAGARAVIPLDENGLPNGTPTLEGYQDNQVAALISVPGVLPEIITIAPGLTEAELTTPRAGQWLSTVSSIEAGCRVNQSPGDSAVVPITFDAGQVTIGEITGTPAGENIYTYARDDGGTFTLEFTGGFSAVETGVYTGTFTSTETRYVPISPGSREVHLQEVTTTQTCTTTVISNLIYQGE
jgi:hypothetical protein